MRVLHVYSGNLYGGVETLLATLHRHRDLREGMRTEFALCFEGRLSRELVAAGAQVRLLGAVRTSRPWSVIRARRALRNHLRANAYDVVVCHSVWSHAMFAPVVRELSIPLAFFLHEITTGRHWLDRWARRTPPDFSLCNSDVTRASHTVLFPSVGSATAYLPVDLPETRVTAAQRAAVRAELHTPDDAIVVIQASRLAELKGHRLHLKALSALRDRGGWVCWLAGGAQTEVERRYLEDLRAEAQRAGIAERVRFLGERGDVQKLLRAADIHCQPNTGPESFGIAFVEALAAGLPVVTTRLGAALEILDASCARLVLPDATALAGALSELLDDAALRRRLGAAGPARARALSDPAARLAGLERLLASIAGRRRADAPHVAPAPHHAG